MFKATLCALAGATLLCSPSFAQQGADGDPIPGQVIVKVTQFQSESIDTLIADIEVITGTDTVSVINTADRLQVYTLKYPVPTEEDQQDAIDEIFADSEDAGNIVWHEPNRVIDAHGQTGSIWVSGIDINATSYQSQYARGQLNLDQTHDQFSRGAGTLVAVIDTGIDPTHPELLGRVSQQGTNTIIEGGSTNDSGEGDHAGHGTFVAGLVSLVAPDALLLPITVLRGDGTGFPVDIADGIAHATDLGAHVIVLALGTTQFSNAIRLAIDDAMANGATVIAAAGNTLPQGLNECLFPANYLGSPGTNEGVLAVSANNDLDQLSMISNFHSAVRLCAPGESFIPQGSPPVATRSVIGPLPGGEYAAATGTSFSTAFVAGAAALVRAQYVNWPDQQMPVGAIGSKVMVLLENSNVLVSMPTVPGNQVEDKPRLDTFNATASGPAIRSEADLNGDGWVDGRDLAILLGAWGELPNDGSLHAADMIRDEIVDGGDLAVMLGSWRSK